MSPDTMIAGRARALSPRAGLIAWATITVVLITLLSVTLHDVSTSAVLAALMLFGFGIALLWIRLVPHYPHARFGACNGVTLLRAGLGASLLAPLVAGDAGQNVMGGWAIPMVALLALSLDGLDGWLARRHGLVSGFGARFDMEVDAALALMLALHAMVDGMTGPVVLALGVMRYIFVAASWALPWMAAPLPDRFGRKLVCVIQIAALIALQVPGMGSGLAQLTALAAVTALLWSFGRDTLWLWRHRT